MSFPLPVLIMRQLRPTYLSGHRKLHADRRHGESAVCSFTLLSWLTLRKALPGPYLVLSDGTVPLEKQGVRYIQVQSKLLNGRALR